MGRLRSPDTWCIVKDKESGHILCVQPTAEPSYNNKTRYEVLGNLTEEEDATQFLQYKRLDMNCDAIAYLQQEHAIHHSVDKIDDIDMAELESMSERVRESTGRACFGHCKSLEKNPACATCYANIPDTWNLCAIIQVLRGEKARRSDR